MSSYIVIGNTVSHSVILRHIYLYSIVLNMDWAPPIGESFPAKMIGKCLESGGATTDQVRKVYRYT